MYVTYRGGTVDHESWMIRGSFGKLWRSAEMEGRCYDLGASQHPARCTCGECDKSLPAADHVAKGGSCNCGIYGVYDAKNVMIPADVIMRVVHWGAVQEWTDGVKSEGATIEAMWVVKDKRGSDEDLRAHLERVYQVPVYFIGKKGALPAMKPPVDMEGMELLKVWGDKSSDTVGGQIRPNSKLWAVIEMLAKRPRRGFRRREIAEAMRTTMRWKRSPCTPLRHEYVMDGKRFPGYAEWRKYVMEAYPDWDSLPWRDRRTLYSNELVQYEECGVDDGFCGHLSEQSGLAFLLSQGQGRYGYPFENYKRGRWRLSEQGMRIFKAKGKWSFGPPLVLGPRAGAWVDAA